MKVICKLNNLNNILNKDTELLIRKYMNRPSGEIDQLEVSKEYTVYGIEFRSNYPWYYLIDDWIDDYPTPYPADLFDISDERLSRYWRLDFEVHQDGTASSRLVFDEWAKEPMYQERLVDGEPEEVELFMKYKQLMDEEVD